MRRQFKNCPEDPQNEYMGAFKMWFQMAAFGRELLTLSPLPRKQKHRGACDYA